MTLEQVRALANAQRYTQEIKSAIADEAAKYGIVIPNCKCRNKWHDAIMQVYHAMKSALPVVKVKRDPLNITFVYKKTTASRIGGKIYDENSPVEDIISLRNAKPTVFNALYEEKEISLSITIGGEKEAENTPKEVEFYPNEDEGTVREEVSE